MAPHLTQSELDLIQARASCRWCACDILAEVAAIRDKEGVEPPKVWAVRRAMRGRTHKRSRVETRGRKKAMTRPQVQRLDRVRQQLIRQADGAHEVTYPMLVGVAKLNVSRWTAARELRELGVKWRRMREKPIRTPAQEANRADVCQEWRKRPAAFWTHGVDLIIDNKKFPLPTSAATKKRLMQQKVRGVHRTASEGLAPGFTRPNARKHKFDASGYATILAGICLLDLAS